jgi:hypothetical protein
MEDKNMKKLEGLDWDTLAHRFDGVKDLLCPERKPNTNIPISFIRDMKGMSAGTTKLRLIFATHEQRMTLDNELGILIDTADTTRTELDSTPLKEGNLRIVTLFNLRTKDPTELGSVAYVYHRLTDTLWRDIVLGPRTPSGPFFFEEQELKRFFTVTPSFVQRVLDIVEKPR